MTSTPARGSQDAAGGLYFVSDASSHVNVAGREQKKATVPSMTLPSLLYLPAALYVHGYFTKYGRLTK